MRHPFFLTLAACFTLIHCGGPQTTSDPNADSSSNSTRASSEKVEPIRIGVQRAPDSLNPYLSTSLTGEIIAYRLYPTLFRELDRFENGVPVLEPYIVANHVWNEAGTVLTLTLRDSLQWQDGTALTTADVVYSLELQTSAEVAWLGGENKTVIDSWQASTPTDMQVTFKRRSPYNLLNLNEGFIVPKHHFSQWPVDTWPEQNWNDSLVVFGPYQPEPGASDERLILKSLDQARPSLAFAFIREKETLYQLVLSGQLDYAWQLPVERIPDIREKLTPIIFPNKYLGFIAWNPIDPAALKDATPEGAAAIEALKQARPHPVLADKRVRQALNLAMNRQAYDDRFWAGESLVPATPWQAGLPFSDGTVQARPFDPDAAGTLLDEAGWRLENGVRKKDGKPLSLTVITNLGSGIRESYLLAIQADMKKIGVDFQVGTQEPSLYLDNMMHHQYDGMIAVLRLPTRPDLRAMLHSESFFEGGGNLAAWTNGDQHLDNIRDAESMDVVQAEIAALERKFFDEVPLTLLFTGQWAGAASGGLAPKPNAADPLADVESWPR